MKYLMIVIMVLLFGCTESEVNKLEKVSVDQCLRQELFIQCMNSLPAGPDSTVYNDWDEVVSECRTTAYHGSARKLRYIKEECRVE